MRPIRPLALAAAALALAGCPAPSSDSVVGGPCAPDGTCGNGLSCAQPLAGGDDRYCAPPCSTVDDCAPLLASSYRIGVPDTVTPLAGSPTPTVWREKTLSRGVACAPLGGASGAPKVCQFGCGNFMALSADGKCYCLPGYSLGPDKRSCVFGTSHQCSIFSYATPAQRQGLLDQYGIQTQAPKCDACNSDTRVTGPLGCHTDEFFCDLRTTSMNGDCTEVLTSAQFNQCIQQKTNFACTCSDQCVESCADVLTCADCCTCAPTSQPLPPPMCSRGVDGGSDGGRDGGAPDLDAGGTLGCADVYDCYFAGNGCWDQSGNANAACLAACDARAKTQQYARDAEALLKCGEEAAGGPCASACNDPSDAGMDRCQTCVFGSCDGNGVCSGGVCSAITNTCDGET